jgi:hypothetical protein
MRIPFPERVNLTHVLIFATALCFVQIFEGTNPFFSGCVFCFLLVAAIGFNIAGGIVYPSGAFIFFNAIFTVVLPGVTKAILREPADSNLLVPVRTIEVYLLGMVAMLAAAIFSRRFRPRKALIAGMLPAGSLHAAYVGCAVLAILMTFYLTVFPNVSVGSFSSFIVQVNRFPLLTFVLGIIYTVHRTNGRRSVSGPLLFMIAFLSANGLLSFSKELFLAPFFAWAVTAALLQYRLHWINIVAFVAGLYLVVAFMVPYAQYGRNITDSGLSQVQLAAYLLTHMDEVREGYAEDTAVVGKVHYYNEHLSLLDRLDIVAGDDALIDVADHEGAYGYLPIFVGFENLIPHVFFPNKPMTLIGNVYGHQIGILPDDDETTGISFSPSADAYREGLVMGVIVAEPLLLMLIFVILDSVIGDVRLNPVGLLTTMLVSRLAFEGALAGNIGLIGQALFTNVLAAYVCAYVLPMLGSIFSKRVLTAAQISLPELMHEKL